jgi:hypothetical protein
MHGLPPVPVVADVLAVVAVVLLAVMDEEVLAAALAAPPAPTASVERAPHPAARSNGSHVGPARTKGA